jgi:hypothetical protein
MPSKRPCCCIYSDGVAAIEGIVTRQAGVLDQVDIAHSAGAKQRRIRYPAKVSPVRSGMGRMLVADMGLLRRF